MNSLENPFFKSSLSQSVVDKEPSPRASRFREDVAVSLENGLPLLVNNPPPNGDRMIHRWATESMLLKYAHNRGIVRPQINIKYQGDGLFFDRNVEPIATNVLGSTPPMEANVYWKSLVQIGAALGIEVTHEDFLRVPQPLKTDLAPFTSVDRDLIIEQGEELRRELLKSGSSVTVVAQAGSIPVKRFSDEQVLNIADAVLITDPKTHLVIVSDKGILLRSLSPQIDLLRDIEAGKRTGGILRDSRGFPLKDEKFIASLSENPYGSVSDSVFIEDNINRIASIFYAADRAIAADGFWAWLCGGGMAMRNDKGILNEDALFVLYTIASARAWGIPGSVTVESDAIGLERKRGKLSTSNIIDPFSYVDNTTKDYTASHMADQDVTMLISEYKQKVGKSN